MHRSKPAAKHDGTWTPALFARRSAAPQNAPGRVASPGNHSLTRLLQPERGASDVRRAAAEGTIGPARPLPHLATIQQSFGPAHDLSQVRAYIGGNAAGAAGRMGAAAYAVGDRVAFAAPPDLRTAAHEATHVVQQRQGVNVPGGVGSPGDRHEQHADAVAARVALGGSVQGLLGAAPAAAASGPTPGGAAVQMAPQKSHYGKFIDTKYIKRGTGADIHLEFEPGNAVNAKKIGFVQSVKTTAAGKPVISHPTEEGKIVTSGPGKGFLIDRVSYRNNPVYGSPSLGRRGRLSATASTNNSTYKLGHRYKDRSGAVHKENAWMEDTPMSGAPPDSGMEFETTALALQGKQAGAYYGSVRWGWKRDAADHLDLIPFALVSQGTPSQNFLAAASQWNSAHIRGTLVARNNPTQVDRLDGAAFKPDFTIAKGTRVKDEGMAGDLGQDRLQITVENGPEKDKAGDIRVTDLHDKGGKPTIDLPSPDVFTIGAAKGAKLNDGVPGKWTYNDTVPQGTRVERGRKRKVIRPGKVVVRWVRVVDGPNTGKEGFVPETDLKAERP